MDRCWLLRFEDRFGSHFQLRVPFASHSSFADPLRRVGSGRSNPSSVKHNVGLCRPTSAIPMSACETMCAFSEGCSARRCGSARAPRSFTSSNACVRSSKSGRAGSDRDLDALAELLRALPVESAVPIARAFSHFLTLANIAEQHHRVRRRRDYLRDPNAPPQRGSCEETFERLLASGITPDALHAATMSLRVELVLTAHPTAITRRTLIQKHLRIAGALASQDRVDLTAPERAEIVASLRREILAAWETDEIRARRPTPVDEAIAGLLIFEQTLWDAVPRFLRTLERRAGAYHRPQPSSRCGPAEIRVVDGRRSRWQSDRHTRGDASGVQRCPMDGCRPLRARNCGAPVRAVDHRGHAGTSRTSQRRQGAVSRRPAGSARSSSSDARGTRRAIFRAPICSKGTPSDLLRRGSAVSLHRRIRRASPALLPIAPRDRSERHRGRTPDRRAATHGRIWPDSRPARSPAACARHAEALDAITRHRGLGRTSNGTSLGGRRF